MPGPRSAPYIPALKRRGFTVRAGNHGKEAEEETRQMFGLSESCAA